MGKFRSLLTSIGFAKKTPAEKLVKRLRKLERKLDKFRKYNLSAEKVKEITDAIDLLDKSLEDAIKLPMARHLKVQGWISINDAKQAVKEARAETWAEARRQRRLQDDVFIREIKALEDELQQTRAELKELQAKPSEVVKGEDDVVVKSEANEGEVVKGGGCE